eukprot:137896-Chlamydomonas_euryale.AAC.6
MGDGCHVMGCKSPLDERRLMVCKAPRDGCQKVPTGPSARATPTCPQPAQNSRDDRPVAEVVDHLC